jgi:hypothetical protein
MKTKRITALSFWITTVLLAWTVGYNMACAQDQVGPTTPGAIPNPGTYQGSMQIQQQQDQQAQQFRDQQNQQFQQNMRQQQSGAPAAVASGPDLRAIWVKRPLVPPNQNPLFGRWNAHAAPPIGPKDSPLGDIGSVFGADVAQLTAGMLQSVCDSMFGNGVVEFRPTTLVSVGRDGRERVLTRVEYHGGGDTIAVLPLDPGSFGAAVFDFKGHDKIIAKEIGCTMARAGAAPTAQPGQAVAVSAPQATGAATGAVLVVTTPLRGGHVLILKHDVEVALTNGGLRAAPNGSAMKTWEMACANRTPACQQGVQAVAADVAGMAVTDAAGRGQTLPLPAGRYYVFNSVHISNKPMMWNLPVDLKAGTNSLTLDQHNLTSVQ